MLEPRPAHGLFFAVMMPLEARHEIAARLLDYRARFPFLGRPIGAERLHLSLNPVLAGDVLPEKVIELSRRVGGSIRFQHFQVRLDRALSYRNRKRKKPFVLAASDPADVSALGDHIAKAFDILSGHKARGGRPVSPHVTLVWDAFMVPEHPISPVIVPVREVSLVHSHIGQSRYDILARWPLVE